MKNLLRNIWFYSLGVCAILAIMPAASYAAFSIDTGKVEKTWLDWTNTLRKEQWVAAYVSNAKLNATAYERSNLAKTRGYISHERTKGDWYYNYTKITKRFSDRNVTFKSIRGATYSESIWYGYVSCRSGDCTDALINAMKSTWTFFTGEKWKKSAPHYNALINPNFTMMWVWFSVDEKTKRYYVTIHYASKIVEKK